MNKIGFIFAFSLGAAVGAAVSAKIVKTKYEQIARDEIADVKEHYARKYGTSVPVDTASKESSDDEEEDEEERARENAVYADLASIYTGRNPKDVEKEVSETRDAPYVIPPEEFGTDEEFEIENLIYYTDGILADDKNNVIMDVERLVGADALHSFGEYEEDSVHVRNESLKKEFEILASLKSFSEVTGEY